MQVMLQLVTIPVNDNENHSQFNIQLILRFNLNKDFNQKSGGCRVYK